MNESDLTGRSRVPVQRRSGAAFAALFAFMAATFAAPHCVRAADDDEAPAAAANADPAGRPGLAHAPAGAAPAAGPVPAPAAAGQAQAPLSGDDGEAVDALTRVRTKGFLRVAVYRNFTPFHDDGKGGLDDDIAAELARRLGVKVAVQSYLAGDEMGDDFRNAIWKGHYLGTPVSDVMLHVPADPALAKDAPQVEILAPYASEQTVVAYDSERLSNWKGMESLGAFRAGVETQSMPDLYLLSFGGQYRSQIDHFPELWQAVQAMKAGELQVVVGSRTKLESAIGADSARFHTTRFNGGVYGRAIDLGLAVKKGEVKLAAALADAVKAMRADGAFERIYAAHHATWVPPEQ
jgi:ABC-type amino acid transport substrate-binding protein